MLIFHNVPLLDERILNVYVEWNAKIIPPLGFDVGVHKCIIYDEIPDDLLDSYNRLKKIYINED